jgi:hypothetical protein
MQWIEDRILQIERRLESLVRQIQDLIPQLRAAAQTARNAFQQYQPGSGGGGSPLYCIVSGGLAASGTIGSGSPTSLASQSVYSITGGAFVLVSSSATVYNGLPDAISSSASCILLANADGTYSIIAVAC